MRDAGDDVAVAPAVPKRRWGRRVFVTLLVAVLVLVVLQWQTGRRAGGRLAAEIAACRAAGEPTTVDELNRWDGLRSGAGENVVPLLRAAAGLINVDDGAWRVATDSLAPPPLTEDEAARLATMLRANEAALAKLDEASAAGRIDWDPHFTSPLVGQTLSSDLTQQRSLVNLLWAASLLAHHQGDDAEALRRVGQILLVSRALDHQPFLTHHLTAIGCAAVANRVLGEEAPDLRVGGAGGASREQVRALVAELLDDRALNEGQRRAWVGERVMQLELPRTALAGGGGAVAFGGMSLNIPGAGFVWKPMLNDNARAMSRFTTAMMKAMASSRDLASYNANLGDPVPEVKRSPGRYTLTSILMPSLNRAAQQHYLLLADRRLAATCLAVRLYATDHQGALPERLDDLVPAYLPAVPLDPVATGGVPIRYVNSRADAKDPRVYSVGADGTDDGGKEPDPASSARGRAAQPSDQVRHLLPQPRPPAQ
jgi:hypothetical protein